MAIFVTAAFAAGPHPFSFAQRDGHLRVGVWVNEGLASLQSRLEVRQRETGINGEKCPARVGGLNERAALSAVARGAVAQDVQQWFGIGAIGFADHAILPREIGEFPGLLNISAQQNQKLSWAAPQARSLIADQINVTGEQGHHFFGSSFLADAGDTFERTKRTWNRSGRCFRCDDALLSSGRTCRKRAANSRGTNQCDNYEQGRKTQEISHRWHPPRPPSRHRATTSSSIGRHELHGAIRAG